jgi:predicted XRE-type DNA-binding protein
MATITATSILNAQSAQFAMFLRAYHECSEAIQGVVDEMSLIIVDETATEEDKAHAAETMVEALFPKLTADMQEGITNAMHTRRSKAAREELDKEEEMFATKLKMAMEAADISQTRLAELTDVSQPAISNMLNRKCRPHRGTVEKLARALKVPPTELWPDHK